MGVEKKYSWWPSDERRLWVGVLFLLMGVGVLRGAFWIYQEETSFEKTAASASATVIGVKKERGTSRYGPSYLARVQFIDLHGNTRRLYSRTGNPWAYERGETVTILYQSDNPESVVIDDWYNDLMWYFTEILLGGCGLIFLAVALSVFIRIFIRSRDASAAKNPE